MSWNYRFVRFENDPPIIEGFEHHYELCEVYYNRNYKPWGYCEATPICCDTEEERFELACWISAAAAKEVLDVSDICHLSDSELEETLENKIGGDEGG